MTDTIYDIEEELLTTRLFLFEDKENLEALLKAYVIPKVDNIAAIEDMMKGVDIRSAEGEQLIRQAKLYNVNYIGLSDEQIRLSIIKSQLILKADGTVNNFLASLKILLEDIDFSYTNTQGLVEVTISQPQNVVDEEFLNNLCPIGVKAVLV